jgi:hypothetical protein
VLGGVAGVQGWEQSAVSQLVSLKKLPQVTLLIGKQRVTPSAAVAKVHD